MVAQWDMMTATAVSRLISGSFAQVRDHALQQADPLSLGGYLLMRERFILFPWRKQISINYVAIYFASLANKSGSLYCNISATM
jgi:hypothetical protein